MYDLELVHMRGLISILEALLSHFIIKNDYFPTMIKRGEHAHFYAICFVFIIKLSAIGFH